MGIKIISIVALASLPLTGCVSAKPLTLPDGSQGMVIRCSGEALDIAACYQQAGKVCPHGYQIVAANQENNPSMMVTRYSMLSGNDAHRSLIIRCK